MPKVLKKKPVVSSRPQQQQSQQQQQHQRRQQQHSRTQRAQGQHTRGSQSSNRQEHPRTPAPGGSWWTCASIIDQQSAEVLERLLLAAETRRGGASIKSLTLAPHIVHKKPTFAVTCETLKHLPLLKQLVANAGLLELHSTQLSPAAAYVLCYEVLFGQGLRRKGPAEKAVLQQQDQLRAGLQELLQQAGVQDAASWLQAAKQQQQQHQQPVVQHPRCARVNTLKATVQQVLAQLQAEGFEPHSSSAGGSSGSGPSVRVDGLLPDLLVFPAGTDLHDHQLVEQGVLILQSKASCIPAQALQPAAGWHVVDCCAAPGNKTTHVAALLHASTAAAAASRGQQKQQQQQLQQLQRLAAAPISNGAAPDTSSSKAGKKRGRQEPAEPQLEQPGPSSIGTSQGLAASSSSSSIRVYAFDKDPKRLKRLVANVDKAGAAGIVSAQQADFLTIDPLDPQYAQVKGVILDPSCSGSGTTLSRLDHLLPGAAAAAPGGALDEQEQQRVEHLARFQEAALLHALQFPALQRLVYSTCSIHQRENEDVVAAVLPAASAAGFQLVDPFPAWHRRGLPVFERSELLVRTDALQDETDGFFVAVFERQAAAAAAVQEHQPQEAQQQQDKKKKHKKKKKKHAAETAVTAS